jgi:CheY-like chemotaxis protein
MNPAEKRPLVMLVEDNPGDVYLFRRALDQASVDAELVVFEDGANAISFTRSPAGRLPDLVVLDLNLPKKGGAEVLRAIRGTSLFAEVPVLVLTSSASPRDLRETEAFGVQQYLTKPIDFEGFLLIGELVKELLQRAPSRDSSL